MGREAPIVSIQIVESSAGFGSSRIGVASHVPDGAASIACSTTVACAFPDRSVSCQHPARGIVMIEG